MDIWSWIIVSTIALIAILSVIDNSTQKRKVNDKLKALYAIIYQTKEYTKFIATFHDNIGKIKTQLPQINGRELVRINISLLRKSWALAAVACSRTEKSFDFIKNTSFTNIEMSREDSQLIADILKAAYGDEFENYDIDLNDDRLESIHKIFEEETNKKAAGNS